jgi:threonine aldolase
MVIDKMPHLMKIHGGSMYGNWANAAMALHRLDGFEERLQNSIKRANEIFTELNKQSNIKITPLEGGTNIYNIVLLKGTDGSKLKDYLDKNFNIKIPPFNKENQSKLMVNKPAEEVIQAFKKSMSV